MAREIKIKDIAGLMEEEVQTIVDVVAAEWIDEVKNLTPVDTGRLYNGWQIRPEKFRAVITNNVEYAEPVCFGNNLPPSWGGRPRSKPEGFPEPPPGFPELIGKEKATVRVPELIAAFRRKN